MSHCPAGHDTQATDYCDVCGLAIVSGATGASSGGAGAADPSSAAPATPAGTQCPHCGAGNPPNALFCETCGYDFTTGSLPRGVEPADVPATPSGPGAAARAASSPSASSPSASSTSASSTSTSTPSAAAAAAAGPTDPAPENPSPAPADAWVTEVWIDPDWYSDQKSTDPLPSPGIPIVVALRHTSILIGRASRSRGIQPDLDLSSDSGISRRHAQLTTDGRRWFVEDLDSSNGTFVGPATGPLPGHAIAVGKRQEISDDDRIYLGAWTRLVVRRASPGEL